MISPHEIEQWLVQAQKDGVCSPEFAGEVRIKLIKVLETYRVIMGTEIDELTVKLEQARLCRDQWKKCVENYLKEYNVGELQREHLE